MKKIIPFPLQKKPDAAMLAAMQRIEKRFGMSFWEYMGFSGDQAKIRKQIEHVLRKETWQMATRLVEEEHER